jgi:hypothetical protein
VLSLRAWLTALLATLAGCEICEAYFPDAYVVRFEDVPFLGVADPECGEIALWLGARPQVGADLTFDPCSGRVLATSSRGAWLGSGPLERDCRDTTCDYRLPLVEQGAIPVSFRYEGLGIVREGASRFAILAKESPDNCAAFETFVTRATFSLGSSEGP